jgi:hypothetical protein
MYIFIIITKNINLSLCNHKKNYFIMMHMNYRKIPINLIKSDNQKPNYLIQKYWCLDTIN